MGSQDSKLFGAFLLKRLGAPSTWVTAAVVGTFINLYGLALVPWLRGSDPVTSFLVQLEATPAVSLLSILLGYLFPVGVGVYSSASMLFATRHTASLADFPDRKPDPVFRVDADGVVVDAGRETSALFQEHGVHRAADILGAGAWRQITGEAAGTAVAGEQMVIHFERADRWYLVAWARGTNEHLNLYLTSIAPELASRLPESPDA